MYTWTQWKALVDAAYRTTAQNNAAIHRAVAAFVKGQITREVDRDLVLSKSYRNEYAAARVALAGYAVSEDLATIKTAVNRLITVDANRPAIANFVSDACQHAMDELNGGVTLYSALLLEAAIHIQQQVESLQGVHETYFQASDLAHDGALSIGSLPDGCSPRAMAYLKNAPALAEGVAYTAGDAVESNSRIYLCTVGGTISPGQLGDGLSTLTADAEETIDGVTFLYDSDVVDTYLELVSWSQMRPLKQANPSSTPVYAYGIDPVSQTFFALPQVDEDHKLCLEWMGVKRSFSGSDTVPFDEQCARAAAEFIRSHLAIKFGDSTQEAAIADGRYKEMLRRIAADWFARRAGI